VFSWLTHRPHFRTPMPIGLTSYVPLVEAYTLSSISPSFLCVLTISNICPFKSIVGSGWFSGYDCIRHGINAWHWFLLEDSETICLIPFCHSIECCLHIILCPLHLVIPCILVSLYSTQSSADPSIPTVRIRISSSSKRWLERIEIWVVFEWNFKQYYTIFK
jgi:hypothetical protein